MTTYVLFLALIFSSSNAIDLKDVEYEEYIALDEDGNVYGCTERLTSVLADLLPRSYGNLIEAL